MKLKKLTNCLILYPETDIERENILNIDSIEQKENGSFVLNKGESV